MAMDIFLKIDDVKGESKDRDHAGEIDVLAWSFGGANSGSTHMGSGAAAGRVNIQDLSLTKHSDRSSPTLMLACCTGKHYRTAKLTVRTSGERPVEFLVLELTDLIVTSVGVGGSGGDDRLTENLSLDFARFKYSYTPRKPDGTADAVVSMGWDIVRNQPA